MLPCNVRRLRPNAGPRECAARFAYRFGQYTMMGGIVLSWSIAGLVLWLGAQWVCPEGACRVLVYDRQVLAMLYALQRPWLDSTLAAATWLGSVIVLLPLAVALAWRYRRRAKTGATLLLPLAVGGAWLLAHAGKLLVARPRPDLHPALITMPADLSFPSAHAMQITAFVLAWLMATRSRPGMAAFSVATVLVLVVTLSRLHLQVHFPSDVVIGMIASTAWVIGLRYTLGSRA
jgi:membrane-associated phospholipid phosphatase